MVVSIANELKCKSLVLLREYHACPSVQLRNQIVKLNYGLVKREATRWTRRCTEPYEDLVQVGSLGLIRAIERFDLLRGRAFSSFAVPFIQGEIQHYLRDKGYLIRIPRCWHEMRKQAVINLDMLRSELGRQPTDAEIAERLNISLLEWRELKLAYRNRSPLSLDVPVHQEDKEVKLTLGELLPDMQYHNFQLAQEEQIRVQQTLEHLEEQVREVLEFIFLHDLTQKETAQRLGVTPVTVARRLRKGLRHFRQQEAS